MSTSAWLQINFGIHAKADALSSEYGYVPFSVLDPSSTGRQTREGSRTLEVNSYLFLLHLNWRVVSILVCIWRFRYQTGRTASWTCWWRRKILEPFIGTNYIHLYLPWVYLWRLVLPQCLGCWSWEWWVQRWSCQLFLLYRLLTDALLQDLRKSDTPMELSNFKILRTVHPRTTLPPEPALYKAVTKTASTSRPHGNTACEIQLYLPGF